MRISSPLANFTIVLSQIRDSAETYMETLESNESSTRTVLIDPILRTLGWDTSNPFMVEVEKPIDKGRVDYALIGVDQEVKVIIEAKRLGTDLSDKGTFLSIVQYAFSAGVADIFLTDGIKWLHFKDFKPGTQDPTNRFSLAADDLVEIASYLVQRLDAARYWPEEKDVDAVAQSVNQLESEIAALQQQVAMMTQGASSGLVPEAARQREDISPAHKGMTRLAELGNMAGKRPSRLLLPDGAAVAVRTWTDVLTHCCRFTMQRNPAIKLPFKDAAGKKINLLALDRPARGITFFEVEYQGQQVYVYTNYDSNNCVRNALHILEQLPEQYRSMEPAVSFA